MTQRSVLILFSILIWFVSLPCAAAQLPVSDDTFGQTISVGLLSARDAKPVVQVESWRTGDDLSVILTPVNGPARHHVLSGQLFLTLEDADKGSSGRVAGPVGADPFSVQAGSYGSAAAAERRAAELRGHWPETDIRVLDVRLGDGKTVHRVLAGRFSDRNSALAFTTTLAAYGVDGAFVISSDRHATVKRGTDGDAPLVFYNRATGLILGLQTVAIARVPSTRTETGEPQPAFRLDGAPYRGSLLIRGSGAGLVAVNQVSLEAYLAGVVPCELGPDRFPLLEALKAQAVTARTYALKHAGRHRGEGFDLCDTPHCQVYGGAGREKPLSSEAVRQTAGLVAYYGGSLAETLYTSTCGGQTEISSALFSGPAEPYLSGVPCTTARHGVALKFPPISVRPTPKISEAESGIDLGLALGLLEAIDVLLPGELNQSTAAGPVNDAQARQWIQKLATRHKGGKGSVPASPLGNGTAVPPTRGQLALLICQTLGWEERLEILFSNADLEELVGSEGGCADRERRALSCLLWADIFRMLPDGRAAAGEPSSRGRFASALARLAQYLEPRLLTEAVLAGGQEGTLHLRIGAEVKLYLISGSGIRLFEQRGASSRPVPAGRFQYGDRVLVHLDRRGQAALMVRQPAMGADADRYSPYSRWSVVVERETIEGLLKDNGHRLGRLLDLQPLERGPGHRLARLRVHGESGQTVLRGLDIRWNLGIRENFFFIDRLKGEDGLIRAYRFTGKGWGHGVGMCQVGAAGLAEAGADFLEILQHFYPGISIEAVSDRTPQP